VDPKLIKKVFNQKQTGDKTPIKTWARASEISPDFVGHTFAVHNGRVFINVYVQEGMVGYRLGEFSPTRTFRSHGRVVAREISKT
jgi:small subunit ribosomal protein S19